MVAIDYAFMGQGEEKTSPILVAREARTGLTLAVLVCRKGANDDWVITRIVEFLDSMGFHRMVWK